MKIRLDLTLEMKYNNDWIHPVVFLGLKRNMFIKKLEKWSVVEKQWTIWNISVPLFSWPTPFIIIFIQRMIEQINFHETAAFTVIYEWNSKNILWRIQRWTQNNQGLTGSYANCQTNSWVIWTKFKSLLFLMKKCALNLWHPYLDTCNYWFLILYDWPIQWYKQYSDIFNVCLWNNYVLNNKVS